MGAPVLSQKQDYTWEDYLSWDDENRYEVIDGKVYALSAPNQNHQRVLGRLFITIDICLEGQNCEVFMAPSDVKLDEKTVVQPDIFVVCDKSKLDGQFTNGAPDLIIEILSKSTIRIDRLLKYNKYLKAGVKEYWIVDPELETITVFTISGSNYEHKIFADNDKVKSKLLKKCNIDLTKIFVS